MRRLDAPETPEQRRSMSVGFYMFIFGGVLLAATGVVTLFDIEIPRVDTALEKTGGIIGVSLVSLGMVLIGVEKMLDAHVDRSQ